MDTLMITSLRERGSCRRHASGMARTPAGRTPSGPTAFRRFEKGWRLGDTSPERVRAVARSRSD